MKNASLSIRTRLVASFAAILLLAIAASGAGYWGITSLSRFVVATLHGDITLSQAAADVRGNVLELRRFEKDVIINIGTADKVDSYGGKWRHSLQQVRESVTEARKATDDTAVLAKLNSLSGSLEQYVTGFGQVQGMIASRAITTTQQANLELDKFKDSVRQTEALADEISDVAMERARKVESATLDKRDTVETTLLILTALGVIAAIVMAWAIIGAITTPLATAVSLATKVAGGQLGNTLVIARHDEFGRLLQSLKDMDANLHDIVFDMRVTADKVNNGTKEIAIGNDDLSQRTQEQASALEQTAASIEEMTASVQQNASNATEASELARGACAVAEHGGTVVQRVVGAMNEISSSSNRIASIVGVIDDIAFQTNLLALNAAVEAARAGEQGRGFAVVATEVRNLAQRSATAAKEIKSLINESVDKVKAGAELVANSGHALSEIVTSVKKVSAVVESIAAANDQQSSGIQQINYAITQLDDMTQRNASAVEEIAAVSKSLQDQAELLAEKAMHFKLDDAKARHKYEAPRRHQPVLPSEAQAQRAA